MTLADGLAQGRPGTSAAAPAQGRGHTGAVDLAVTVCRDPREFAALAAEWAALHGRCPQATPFQSHAWLHSWWLSYATRRDRLRVVLVHRQGVLVGAAPLLRTYRPLPVVRPLGGRITDYTDVLVSAAGNGLPDAEVTAALTRGVRRAARGRWSTCPRCGRAARPWQCTRRGAGPSAGRPPRCAWNCQDCRWTG